EVLRSAVVIQGTNELSGLLSISGLRIRDKHAETDRIAASETVSQKAVFRIAWREEHRHVAIDDQLVSRLRSRCWSLRLHRRRLLLEDDRGCSGEQREDREFPASSHGSRRGLSGARR